VSHTEKFISEIKISNTAMDSCAKNYLSVIITVLLTWSTVTVSQVHCCCSTFYGSDSIAVTQPTESRH